MAYSPRAATVALAYTDDFIRAKRVGMIFSPNNKDAVLFPQKFDGRWVVLHYPDAGGIQHIWSAYSPDLVHWGEPHCFLVCVDPVSTVVVRGGADGSVVFFY